MMPRQPQVASPCMGCTDKICRKGEKCIDNVAHLLAQSLLGSRERANSYGENFHRERVRKMRVDKIQKMKK